VGIGNRLGGVEGEGMATEQERRLVNAVRSEKEVYRGERVFIPLKIRKIWTRSGIFGKPRVSGKSLEFPLPLRPSK
jgi:hypothetical protein